MSQQSLNPIKSLHKQETERETGQQRGQGTWLTIHQKRRNKPALKRHLRT